MVHITTLNENNADISKTFKRIIGTQKPVMFTLRVTIQQTYIISSNAASTFLIPLFSVQDFPTLLSVCHVQVVAILMCKFLSQT